MEPSMTINLPIPIVTAIVTIAIGTIIALAFATKKRWEDVWGTAFITVLMTGLFTFVAASAEDKHLKNKHVTNTVAKLATDWKQLYHFVENEEQHAVHKLAISKFLKQNPSQIPLEQFKIFLRDECFRENPTLNKLVTFTLKTPTSREK